MLEPDACAYCRVAGRSLRLALDAAVYGHLDWSHVLLTEAEHYFDLGGHPDHCSRNDRPALADMRLRTGIHRQVAGWSGTGPVVAATDASWKQRYSGLGYVTSTGRFGFRGRHDDRRDPTGRSKALVNELRAVEMLLSAVGTARLTLLVDSLSALGYLRSWQNGETPVMPAGYDLRPRRSGAPALVRLAGLVAGHPGLRLEHVKGHSGHLLNEAADALASIGRRRMTETFAASARADELVRSFLFSWHETAEAV